MSCEQIDLEQLLRYIGFAPAKVVAVLREKRHNVSLTPRDQICSMRSLASGAPRSNLRGALFRRAQK
jgi:hypothetical protein